MKKILFVAIPLLFIASVTALATAKPEPKKNFSALKKPIPIPAAGGQTYVEVGCVMCHGEKGGGDGVLAENLTPKPRIFTSFKDMANVPDSRMADAVRNGIPGTAMPSFPLTDKQIKDLVAYEKGFLADSYLIVQTCAADPYTVDVSVADEMVKKYNIQVQHPDLLQVRQEGRLLHITPNTVAIVRQFKAEKVLRSAIRIVYETPEKKERDFAIITVRIFDCYGDSGSR